MHAGVLRLEGGRSLGTGVAEGCELLGEYWELRAFVRISAPSHSQVFDPRILLFIETWAYYIAQVGLELVILPAQPPGVVVTSACHHT